MMMQSMGPRYSLVTILQSLRFNVRFLQRGRFSVQLNIIKMIKSPGYWELHLIVVHHQ